jgi:multimeric flavodoxin WrbA
MEEKKLKAMFFNGSPRKNKNTADMLQSAMRGAEAAGAECELVNLYDIDFKGCKSCSPVRSRTLRPMVYVR